MPPQLARNHVGVKTNVSDSKTTENILIQKDVASVITFKMCCGVQIMSNGDNCDGLAGLCMVSCIVKVE